MHWPSSGLSCAVLNRTAFQSQHTGTNTYQPLHLSQGNVPTAQEEITVPFSALHLPPSRNPRNPSAAKMNLLLAREPVLCLLHTKFAAVLPMTQECGLALSHDVVHCLCPWICYLINYICT